MRWSLHTVREQHLNVFFQFADKSPMKGKGKEKKTADELFQSQMLTAGDAVAESQLFRQQCPVAGRRAGQPLSAEDRLEVYHSSGLDFLTGGLQINKVKHLQRLMSQLELRRPE